MCPAASTPSQTICVVFRSVPRKPRIRRSSESKISNTHSLTKRSFGYEMLNTAGLSRRPLTIFRLRSRLMTSILTRVLGSRACTPFTTAVMSSRLPTTSARASTFSLLTAMP